MCSISSNEKRLLCLVFLHIDLSINEFEIFCFFVLKGKYVIEQGLIVGLKVDGFDILYFVIFVLGKI